MQVIQRVLELKRPVKVALVCVMLLFLILLIYPFQSTTVPEWSFIVIDDSAAPVAGINVTEHWQHYLIETEGNEQLKVTDGGGRVSFPPRTVRASVSWRLFRTIRSLSKTGIERRRDPYASVVIWGKNYDLTTFVVDTDAPLPDHIRVRAR